MPSAWGSINLAFNGVPQDMPEGATLTGSLARYNGSSIVFTPFYISAFAITGGAGWTALAAQFSPSTVVSKRGPTITFGDMSQANKISYLQGSYSTASIPALKVSGLCQKLGFVAPAPAALNDGKPIDTIALKGFKASILVAEINVFLGKIPLGSGGCLTDKTVLNDMADGSYQPPGGGTLWVQADIANYLHNNWIARRA
jgi:hypothetical protein